MRLSLKSCRGFTLVELIVAIALMALISVIAAPTLTGYLARASLTGGEDTAAEIQAALIARHHAGNAQGAWPAALDRLPAETTCSTVTPCFSEVAMPVTSPQWRKVGLNRYEFRNASLKQTWSYDHVQGVMACVDGDC